ncbi:MAG: class I SAM-dependent methyltransferase [bacterium]|nr:class I SAM-dependent methyltransferase [bacterium]
MVLITEEYLELNRQKHLADEKWGSTAPRYAQAIGELIKAYECSSVLDYGCGKGDLRLAMPTGVTEKVSWWEYDPAIDGKALPLRDEDPFACELVACIDVLEHIEPECFTEVFEHIKLCTRKVVFFVISAREAIHKLPDGSNCHRIIQEPEKWLGCLMDRWKIRSYNLLGDTEVVAVCEKE